MRLGKTYEQVAAREEAQIRRTTRPRVKISSRGFSLFLAIGLVSLIAYVFISDAFYVYDTTTVGNALVSADEIYPNSGVEGYSIFFIDPDQVEKNISSLPDIAEANVKVSLPNKMFVEVQERQPRAIWQTGQERYGVDEKGAILHLRGEVEPGIVIADLDATPHRPGDHIDPGLIAAAERYKTLLPQVTRFDYSQRYGLSLVDEHGWRIYLGDGESADIKVAIMKALVQRLESQGTTVEFIDLRCERTPYYRPPEG